MNRSVLLAVLVAAGAAGWIFSGQFTSNARTSDATGNPGAGAGAGTAITENAPPLAAPTPVRIRESIAAPHRPAVIVTGRTEASRHIEMKARLLGEVTDINLSKGDRITAGEVILQLDPEDRAARMKRAEARITQRQTEFNAADRLSDMGFQAKTRRAETYADLQEAKAELAAVEEEMRQLTFKAPFDAVLNNIRVELGDIVRTGDPVATLYDLDPILVIVQVSELERLQLRPGQPGIARLLDGTELNGRVRYITAAADPQTRTFRVELEIGNPDMQIEQGITAGVVLPLPEVPAHKLSASAFTLNDEGQLGVMIVDADDIVRFRQIRIIDSDADRAFVTGLPERVRLVTVGQEFVSDGETVRPVPEAVVGTPEATAG